MLNVIDVYITEIPSILLSIAAIILITGCLCLLCASQTKTTPQPMLVYRAHRHRRIEYKRT
ncbi:hypothetical protein GBAR_LOCUS25550 [Geodia barretti]|uniref:Uncharacterized protein n=1 Tax=Geodia barretti TaxID=519541 RepID=A0AA35XCX4_GEOBA|nr:hypothetical protein GBAR_LOCUS25550 [Geodia barretti]